MRTRWAPDDCSESYTVTRSINPQRARSTRCCDGAAAHRGAHLSPGAPGFLDQTSRTLWAAAAAPNALKSGLVVFGVDVTRIKIKGLNSLILSYRARLTLNGLFGESAL